MVETRIRTGGLFRCCVVSIDEAMQTQTESPKEGDRLKCKYCHDDHGMIFHDGAWEWAKPRED